MNARLHPFMVRLHPRPTTEYVSQGRSVFATDLGGFIAGQPQHGFFVHETRMISRYRYAVKGEELQCVAASNAQQHTWLGYYICVPPGLDVGQPDTGSGYVTAASQHSLELRLSRHVSDGMHEDVDLTNFTQHRTPLTLELEVDADFADPGEGELLRRLQKGDLRRQWRRLGRGVWELDFDYHAQHRYRHQGNKGVAHLHRGLTLRIQNLSANGAAPRYRGDRVSFQVRLAPGESWHACILLEPRMESGTLPAIERCYSFVGVHDEYDRRRRLFLVEATNFASEGSRTLGGVVTSCLNQAKKDLAALRLYDMDHGERSWTMAAGLPIYVALFGRDTLTAAWESAILGAEMMRGTLTELARWQGTEVNAWRDEEPGRMLHEAHTGPLAALNFNPRARYYGAATTSKFYPVVLAELWHWTGDKELVRPFIAPALKALRWCDAYGDRNRDGLYEYQSHSEQGTQNQGWKDSGDAIVYEDGSQVKPPISTCEEQGFAYAAKLFMAELLWWLDEPREARRLYHQASELKKRFNERFWMEKEGYIAMGLDAHRRQIRSVSSNPGHCIATGILDGSLVERTVERFMAPDLFTGWGIRTLSSQHPAFNPYSYHRGSVWPVEHGTFALGLVRYGFHNHLQRLCRAQFDAAQLFDFRRLPEVFSGHQRDEQHPFPAIYPKANWPQAWSASAVFTMVQAMLGLYPYAPLHALLVDPHLPEWLPELTLENLRVGKATITIRFHRDQKGSSHYEVLDKRGKLHVVRQPSPWSLTATVPERVVDAITSLVA